MKQFMRVACVAIVLSVATNTHAAPIPADPNLKLWVKADSITGLSTGNAVNTWNDSSNNLNHMTVQGGASAPTYNAGTAGVFNGKPTVDFAGSHILHTGSNIGIGGNLTTTSFIVFMPLTTNPYGVFGWGASNFATQAFGSWTGLRGSNLSVEYAGNNPAIFGPYSTSSSQIVMIQKTPGAINTTTLLFHDGVQQAIQAGSSGAVPAVTNNQLRVGAWADFTGNLFHGRVAELIVYDSALSTSASAEITQYLHEKYVPEPAALTLLSVAALILRRRRAR